jgi:hypothetical protein
LTARWGVPDPAEVNDAARRQIAFSDAVSLISWRISLMLALKLDQFEAWVLEQRVRAIADETSGRPQATTEGSRQSSQGDF